MTDDPQRPNDAGGPLYADAPPALVAQVAHHWETYRPKMSRAMKAAGTFDASVRQAAQMTSDAVYDLMIKGVAHDQAWELMREEWAFLPEEEDGEDEDPEA
jgi:hypothetical protein